MTKTQLAKVFEVTIKSVDAWVLKGCPHTRDKQGRYRFDRKQVETWRAATLPTKGLTASASFNAARTRKEQALAGLRELQLQEKRGTVLNAEAVKAQWYQRVRQVRDALLNIPDRVAGLVAAESDQATCHELLRKEIHRALTALAEELTP